MHSSSHRAGGHRQIVFTAPFDAAGKLEVLPPGMSPYSLRHGYAYRGALKGLPLRLLAASMGHDIRTHMKHYGQWTDEAGLDAAFGAANERLTAQACHIQCQ